MRKNFLLLIMVALFSTNAFADNDVTINVKGGAVDTYTYTPVNDGNSPLSFTIIKGAAAKASDDYKTLKENADEVYVTEGSTIGKETAITLPPTVQIPIEIRAKATGDVEYEGVYTFKVVRVGDGTNAAFTKANASKLATVTLGSNVTTIADKAFQNDDVLESIVWNDAVKTIGANAFQGTSLASVTLPVSVETIGVSAFEGCDLLDTFTVPADSKLGTIGNQAFFGTSMTSLDLSGATKYAEGKKVYGLRVINRLFTKTSGMEELGKKSLLSITLPTTVTTIAEKAFINCPRLATVTNLDKVKTINANAFDGCGLKDVITLAGDITVGSEAFKGNTKLTGVTFGDIVPTSKANVANTVATNAFDGCTALTTVTYGAIKDAKIEGSDYTASIANAIFAKGIITNLVFAGEINCAATPFPAKAFQGITKLAQIDITGEVKTEEAFAAAIFGDGTTPVAATLKTVNYLVAGTKKPFAVAAFAAVDGTKVITLNTSEQVFKLYATPGDINIVTIKPDHISDVPADGFIGKLADGADPKVKASYSMLNDKNNTKNYYYHFTAGVSNAAIAKKQDDANIVVYSAYFDASDNTICMNPLALNNGKYIVPAGQVVIVKSSAATGVEYYETLEAGTIQLFGIDLAGDYSGAPLSYNTFNLLRKADKKYTYSAILDDDGTIFPKDVNGDCTVLTWQNPATKGWKFENITATAKAMGAGVIYIAIPGLPFAEEDAFAPATKWLDENGNVTGITEVKSETFNNDVIYNLQGIRVNNAQKGIFIKNGKKFIVK